MTLSTDILICEPVNPEHLWEFTMGLLARGVDFEPKWRHVGIGEPCWLRDDGSPGSTAATDEYRTILGQGLGALTVLQYAIDGPLTWWNEDRLEWARETDPEFVPPWFDQHLLRLDFDTAYGYQNRHGGGCSDLHAWLICEITDWLAARGVTKVVYRNEFTGEFHDPSEVRELGNPNVGAL